MNPIARLALVLAVTVLAVTVLLSPGKIMAADSVAVLMYHRVGQERYPSTNITVAQFRAHMRELERGDYTPVSLDTVSDAAKGAARLPDRAVAITFDDAYRSLYENAWPYLKENDIPVALFVATEPVDEGHSDYMNWDQIRDMAQGGAIIGNHTVSHDFLLTMELPAVMQEITEAGRRIRDETGLAPQYFAYPYGEYNERIRNFVAQMGFRAAFAQHSGVVYGGSDLYALPRFALNERYGDLDRFRLVANALPLPVTDIIPRDPHLGRNPPAFGFTLASEAVTPGQITCYPSHEEGAAALQILAERRIEIRFKTALPEGRSRINCTAPGPDGRWRWLSYPFFVR